MKSHRSLDPISIPDIDVFSDDSSNDQLYMNSRNLSLTFFTGVAGSLDAIVADDVNPRQAHIQKSSSLTMNEEQRLRLAFCPSSALPLTQSSYDFRATASTNTKTSGGRASNSNNKGSSHFAKDINTNNNNNNHKKVNTFYPEAKSLPKNVTIHANDSNNDNNNNNNNYVNTLIIDDDDDYGPYEKYLESCRALMIDPQEVGLVPPEVWPSQGEVTFEHLVINFFQTRNSNSLRLPMKLFNALKISDTNPVFEPLLGVSWLNDEIIRINVKKFARLLGVRDANKVLFSEKGFLAKLGFEEMNLAQLSALDPDIDLFGVDLIQVKIMFHSDHKFSRKSTVSDVAAIRVPPI